MRKFLVIAVLGLYFESNFSQATTTQIEGSYCRTSTPDFSQVDKINVSVLERNLVGKDFKWRDFIDTFRNAGGCLSISKLAEGQVFLHVSKLPSEVFEFGRLKLDPNSEHYRALQAIVESSDSAFVIGGLDLLGQVLLPLFQDAQGNLLPTLKAAFGLEAKVDAIMLVRLDLRPQTINHEFIHFKDYREGRMSTLKNSHLLLLDAATDSLNSQQMTWLTHVATAFRSTIYELNAVGVTEYKIDQDEVNQKFFAAMMDSRMAQAIHYSLVQSQVEEWLQFLSQDLTIRPYVIRLCKDAIDAFRDAPISKYLLDIYPTCKILTADLDR